jgi:hypothetical protein
MARSRRHVIAAFAAATIIFTAGPVGAVPPQPGPCALTRGADETIQHFSKRIIRCTVATWPVPGGAEKAICIAARESGLLPRASSATGQYLGLYQHSAKYWPDRYQKWTKLQWNLSTSALSGRSNAVVTIRMVNAHGWGPWKGPGC